MTDDDKTRGMALFRYEAISAYLALDPPRGQRGALLKQLAGKTWSGPDGAPRTVAAETLRTWIRRYRTGGFTALQDKPRPRPGSKALPPELVEKLRQLKREVPQRSIDRVIAIAEGTGLVEPGVLRRSTVHRVLRSAGLSRRVSVGRTPPRDLDRWEADFPNELWQSDLLAGPWLPDPKRPGKMKRAWLFAFLDDHSRLLLHGRFDWKQGLPALELVMKRALQKYGIPRRVYFDNGKVYRSGHTARICAQLGVHRVVFTQIRRPEGHGKIEAFNRFVRSAFLPELAASRVVTLDQLNEAFVAWLELEYNARPHGQTGQAPLERWREAAHRVRYASDEALRQAFLFRERRTPDKAGVFTLCGTKYQVGPKLARRRVEVRYDPEALHEVEVWKDDRLAERVNPLMVHADRRPWPEPSKDRPHKASKPPATDWLDHLVEQRRAQGQLEPDPRAIAYDARRRREEADEAVLVVLRERLVEEALDLDAARDWLARFGPLDPAALAVWLDARLLLGERRDQHVVGVLEAAQAALDGGAV